jgi:hypothetical protein
MSDERDCLKRSLLGVRILLAAGANAAKRGNDNQGGKPCIPGAIFQNLVWL